jgi:hypothetical protein
MKPTQRRLLGLISGLILGFAYSLTSNLINAVVLPDIPFYYPWPGPVLLILGSTLVFGVMGLITTWSDETFIGMLVAAAFGAAVSSFFSWRSEGAPPTFLVLAVLTFLPRLFLYMPLGIAIQWILRQYQRVSLTAARNSGKVMVPVICILLALGSASFSLYAGEIRYALTTTNQLVQEGMAATSEDAIPKPLKNVWYFSAFAKGDYTLEVSLEPDRLPVQRPIVEYGKLVSLIIIRHENKFMYGCVYTPPRIMPVCGNFNFSSP